MAEKIKITKTHNDENDLVLKVNIPTTEVWANITDAIFIVKEKESDALASAKITKTMAGNQIELTPPNQVNISFAKADYTGLTIGYAYIGAVFMKFAGQTDYDERVDTFDFIIKNSIHND